MVICVLLGFHRSPPPYSSLGDPPSPTPTPCPPWPCSSSAATDLTPPGLTDHRPRRTRQESPLKAVMAWVTASGFRRARLCPPWVSSCSCEPGIRLCSASRAPALSRPWNPPQSPSATALATPLESAARRSYLLATWDGLILLATWSDVSETLRAQSLSVWDGRHGHEDETAATGCIWLAPGATSRPDERGRDRRLRVPRWAPTSARRAHRHRGESCPMTETQTAGARSAARADGTATGRFPVQLTRIRKADFER